MYISSSRSDRTKLRINGNEREKEPRLFKIVYNDSYMSTLVGLNEANNSLTAKYSFKSSYSTQIKREISEKYIFQRFFLK